jgi:hypothetical protein
MKCSRDREVSKAAKWLRTGGDVYRHTYTPQCDILGDAGLQFESLRVQTLQFLVKRIQLRLEVLVVHAQAEAPEKMWRQ